MKYNRAFYILLKNKKANDWNLSILNLLIYSIYIDNFMECSIFLVLL